MVDVYKNIVESKSPLIMGIVNVTPDSFSDGGKYFRFENAIDHCEKLIESGADIIDIGGESTRPGAQSINEEEELNRVLPVVKKVLEKFPNTIISIDTTKSKVAEECFLAGAKIINDISGGTFDNKMFDIANKYDAPIVIMHIKGNPKTMQNSPFYENVITEIESYFEERIDTAKSKKVEKIIIDPGIGFGKRVEDNFEILNKLNVLKEFDLPILVGLSKKSFLGKSLNLEIDERENATAIAETIAVINGAKIIRTHNIKNAFEIKKIVSQLNPIQNGVYV